MSKLANCAMKTPRPEQPQTTKPNSDLREILGKQLTPSATFTNDRSNLARQFTMTVFLGSNRTDLAHHCTMSIFGRANL